MNRFEKKDGDPSSYNEKINLWVGKFDKDLDEYLGGEDITIDGLADIIWERGILGHISPDDKDEFEARKALEKDVFERNNPELYWRIAYAAGNMKESMTEGISLVAGYATGATLKGLARLALKNNKKYQELFGEGKTPLLIVERIIEKAREELAKRNIKLHDRLIPIGSTGKFKGIPVKVVRYTPDGLIAVETFNRDDYNRLGELNGYNSAISPGQVNAEDFSIPGPEVKEGEPIK